VSVSPSALSVDASGDPAVSDGGSDACSNCGDDALRAQQVVTPCLTKQLRPFTRDLERLLSLPASSYRPPPPPRFLTKTHLRVKRAGQTVDVGLGVLS
jgi:hypothetical protein